MPGRVGEATVRPDLREARDRHALTLDAARPEAIAKRHALGLRSAPREHCRPVDPGSFVEYGALAFAAQTQPTHARRPDEEHSGRRNGHGHRERQRRAFRRRGITLRRAGLRRDGARRNAGHARPRPRPTGCSGSHRRRRLAGRALCRGWRRAPRRHGQPDRGGPACHELSRVRTAQRPGAGGVHRRRPLLCRQRGTSSAAAT